jgi:hypothetical protein
MSDLVFERGLFATLAAALILPELTTFLLFVFVMLSLSTLLARQAWSLVRVPVSDRANPPAADPDPTERAFRIVSRP